MSKDRRSICSFQASIHGRFGKRRCDCSMAVSDTTHGHSSSILTVVPSGSGRAVPLLKLDPQADEHVQRRRVKIGLRAPDRETPAISVLTAHREVSGTSTPLATRNAKVLEKDTGVLPSREAALKELILSPVPRAA